MPEMKTIGLVGGSSWVSTAEYYATLNRMANEHLGGSHSCRLILHSMQFAELHECQKAQDWDGVAQIILRGAQSVERAGADCVLICANTLHMVADTIKAGIGVPLIHLIDVVGAHIEANGHAIAGLLGTQLTMEHGFYQKKLALGFGIETLVPSDEDRAEVHRSIFQELTRNVFLDSTRERYTAIIRDMASRGAQCAILGCTEIPLLIKQEDSPIPVVDTLQVHCEAAMRFALS